MAGGLARTRAGEQARNIRAGFRDTLALFVGPGRRFQAEEVGAAAGVSADAIRRYLRGESCPEWQVTVGLLAALPLEFAVALLRPAGLTGMRRIDGEASGPETLAEIAQATSELATALADGRIDHTELPAVRRELNRALAMIAQFLARLEEP